MAFRIIAHRCRGFGEEENSLPALKKALASAVDEIEIDYRITRDRKLLVNHDASYRDALDRKHTIAEETLHAALTNGKMSLETALILFRKHGKGKTLNIDIKSYGEEEQLVRLVRKHRLERRVLVVSWIARSLDRVHALAPSLALSYSFTPKVHTLEANGLPVAPAFFLLPSAIKRLPLRTVNIVVRLLPLTRSLVARLHKHGVQVIVVNADTVKENERLMAMGVDGSMTNKAPEILRAFGSQAREDA